MYPTNPLTIEAFNSSESFKKEVDFYKLVVKELEAFAGQVVDFFPKFYGGRLSLTGNEKADKDAVLLLENLKHQNYTLVSRYEGLDETEARFALRKLAAFHGIPVALKRIDPEAFRRILPHLNRVEMFRNAPPKQWTQFQNFLLDCISEKPELRRASETIRQNMKFGEVYPTYGSSEVREPFATIGHNDYWINNMLFAYDPSSKLPIGLKMVDFQMPDYGSLARDLLFMVFTSVNKDVLEQHLDDLLAFYRESFNSTLKELNCHDLELTEREFEEELRREAPVQLEHVLSMLRVVHMKKTEGKDLEKLSEEDFAVREEQLAEGFNPKLWLTVGEFCRKGWIY